MDDETASVPMSVESIVPGSSPSPPSCIGTVIFSVTSMPFNRAPVSSCLLSEAQSDTVDEISTSFDRVLTPSD